MKLDREALWEKFSFFMKGSGIYENYRLMNKDCFNSLLDDIERKGGEPALAKAIELLWSANSWLLDPGAPYQHQRLELAKTIQQFLVAAPSATGQVSPSVAPADSESGSAVGPARSAEPQEPTYHLNADEQDTMRKALLRSATIVEPQERETPRTDAAKDFSAPEKLYELSCQLERELSQAREQIANEACDVCCGSGRVESCKPCMCEGTGRMAVAARYLREQLFNEAQANECAEQQLAEYKKVCENFEITGPDRDGVVWLVLHGKGSSGRAMFNLGEPERIVVQVAKMLEEDRQSALAAQRKD